MNSTRSLRTAHIIKTVLDKADDDSTLSEDSKLVVLAALEGEDSLRSALTGVYPSRPEADGGPTPEDSSGRAVGAFLRSIRVKGFRGIGPEAELSLVPTPGLTVVAGRNGSGKSSFAEAFEYALTGDSYRWKRKPVFWTESWRNIHAEGPCWIRVGLAEEGAGPTTVGVDWPDGAPLRERNRWTQRAGRQREPGLSGLGWDQAIQLYRPILSYEELGGLLESGPSELHDALAVLLGLEQLTDAVKRLVANVKELEAPKRAATEAARELKPELGTVPDERAASVLALMSKRAPDLDAVQAIVTGVSAQPDSDLAALRALTRLVIPTPEEVERLLRSLRNAAARLAEVSGPAVDLAERHATLLREALTFHTHRGDGSCPVCGEGTLDAAWRTRVEADLLEEGERLEQVREARNALKAAGAEARELVRAVAEPVEPAAFQLVTLEAARAAWQRWAQLPEQNVALADHLEIAYKGLTTFTALRDEAAAMLAEKEDAWAPIAARIAGWVDIARRARTGEPMARTVKAASDFLKATTTSLQNTELERLAEKARAIWAALRQESDIDLGAIQLAGSGNQRRVKILASVDGTEAGALGVMSQGELHALALALFVPRATMTGSPFRFLVLDDPIQAMDPAKIDGFVHVLAELAEDRQVIVLSHDDRLPEAVRRMNVGARVLEVCRGPKSTVEVIPAMDPADRYLADASALACDDGVPDNIKSRVIPSLCRMAVEAAARDIFMTRRFSKGAERGTVEDAWQVAQRTRQKVALALRDDSGFDLTNWVGTRPGRKHGFSVVTQGVHNGLQADLGGAIADVKLLVQDLRADAR